MPRNKLDVKYLIKIYGVFLKNTKEGTGETAQSVQCPPPTDEDLSLHSHVTTRYGCTSL